MDIIIIELQKARSRIFLVCRDRSCTLQSDGCKDAPKNANGSTGDHERRGSRSPLLYGAYFPSKHIICDLCSKFRGCSIRIDQGTVANPNPPASVMLATMAGSTSEYQAMGDAQSNCREMQRT